jgi:hypothetical protein
MTVPSVCGGGHPHPWVALADAGPACYIIPAFTSPLGPENAS